MVDLPPVKAPFPVVTTTELKSRAIKSSLGVLPLRRSESIPELNLVHLRGRSVAANDPETVDDLTTSRVGTNTPRTPKHPPPPPINVESPPARRGPLPAILPMVGTTHTANLQPRQAPAKPVVNVPPVKKRKVDVVLIEREALERGTPRSVVKKMIQEAQRISQTSGAVGTTDRTTPYSRMSSKQLSYPGTSSLSQTHQHQTPMTPNDDPSRAAVENLIASIKSKQLQEAQRQSDRRIVDIIHRVLGRTIDLVYDEDEEEEQRRPGTRDGQTLIDEVANIPMILEEDDRTTMTPRGPDISRADIEPPTDQDDLDRAEEEDDDGLGQINEYEKTIDSMRSTDDLDQLDMSNDPLYRHYLMGITNEDLLHVRGTRMDVKTPVSTKSTSRTTKTTEEIEPEDKSVHHFCIQMLDENDTMPKAIRAITQLYHQRARFRHQLPMSSNYYQHGELPNFPKRTNEVQEETPPSIIHTVSDGTPSIPYTGLMTLESDLNIWQRRATELVQPTIEGSSAISEDPYLIRLWAPAPPKMYLHPRRVKEHLFAQYTSPFTKAPLDFDERDEDDDPTFVRSQTFDTYLPQRGASAERIAPPPVIRSYKSLERLPSTIDRSEEFQMLPTMVRTAVSTSNLHKVTDEAALRFDTAFAFTLEETKHQMETRKATMSTIAATPSPTSVEETTPLPQASAEASQVITVEDSSKDFRYFPKTNRSEAYHQALKEGRPFISKARLRAARRARKDAKFWERIDEIIAIATAPPRQPPISRRNSFHEALFYERNHPHQLKQRFQDRRPSLDRQKQNFNDLVKSKYNYKETRVKSAGRPPLTEFQWTRELWYQWLDEYIAELDKQEVIRQEKENTKTSSQTPKTYDDPSSLNMHDDEDIDGDEVGETDNLPKKRSTASLEPIVNLQLPDSEDRRLIENEIHRLTTLIERNPRDVFSLTRRGALLRKLGLFHDALNDLSLAIYIEPSFMDAYWQRALIYMIFDHHDEALESLNMCIKFNRVHAGAYKLRGDIYLHRNDLAMAIANYSQAIRNNPTDHEAYFQRAQAYERRNDILLAMDDYVQVTRLNPKNIDAWYKHAMYYFNSKNYDYALGDFTELLKRQPEHISARLHRGLSHFYLEDYQAALVDFSATLHYDPSNWSAYYHRACLLRKVNPAQALKDFSISLLINPEYENLGSYLHRALIYCDQEQFDEAIADYEAILILDREHAPALCNLAIIYMKRNTQKALDLFTRAIEADPTYVRAYFCRAYFYTQIGQLQQAYSDYTKIYHMFPDQNAAMVLRGNMLLAMGQLDLASFCVEVAAKLQSATKDDELSTANASSAMKMSASSPQQQAIVHSFLEQFDYALAIMERECAYHPTASNYRMLGTLRMKAKRFDEARDAFEKCIQVCSNSITPQTNELFGAYLDLSKCLVQLKRYSQAVDQLSILLKLQQDHPSAEAYLQRGIAKMRMFAKASAHELMKLSSNRRPLLDINRALVIEPNNAEAYLARAAWYARCERYSKGVLNCNEAIRLNPNLVRAYLYRGSLKYSLRLYNHAIADLSKALQIDPSCSHAYYNRALCHIRQNNLSHAAKDFAIVLSLAATGGNNKTQLLELETYVNRGLVHYEHKDIENALADFEHALDLVVRSDDEQRIKTLRHKLIYTIGQCHHRLAQFDQAIQYYNECERTDRAFTDTTYRHDVWIAQANAYMEMRREKADLKATRLFERVLHENPLHERARLNLGYCLRQRGFFQRAWRQFAALLQLNPRHVRALEARALVCLQMNHPTEAFIDLNHALQFEPSSAQLLTNRGVIQQYLGDNRSAINDYRAALIADPKNTFAHYNIGNILMFHGQFLQAIGEFDQVLQINPRDEAALTNRAIAKAALKQYDSARKDFEQALEISPLSAHIHVDLGQLLLTLDEPVSAEKAFSRALEIRPCDPAVYKWRGDARSKQEGKRQAALEDYRTCVELTDALLLARKHGLIKGPAKTRRKL